MDQTGGRVLAVDGSGAELGAVRADEQTYLQGLFQSAAGEVYAMTPKPEGGGIDLHAIDLGSKKLGQTVHSLSYEAYGAYSGGGGYDACYNEGESFCALRLGAQPERLLSWKTATSTAAPSSAASSRRAARSSACSTTTTAAAGPTSSGSSRPPQTR